ncbi:MAG: tetratricopeptide repeat protein [Bacteroidales bacterium]|nr:tetratricopeptide repeat protein [Bacteroidales bacterium]
MKVKSTLKIGILTLMLGFIFTSLSQAQQLKPAGQTKKENQDQRMKAMGIDSVPSTIFPPRKELTEAEKEAQRLFTEGSKKGKAGNYKEAIADLTQSVSLVPNGNSYMKRGFAYLLSAQFPLALQDFTETLRLAPSNREAIFGRGIARFEMKDYTEAEVDLKQYLDLVNINPMAFDYMAALCFMRQDFQCALQNYSDVVRCDSLYPDGWANRAMIRHYLRDYKGALEDYNVAVRINPNDKKIYNNRAAAKMLLKDYKAALEDFNKAIELDPLYADAYNNRGRVRLALGDTEGACADWQKALSFGIEASRDLIIKNCK